MPERESKAAAALRARAERAEAIGPLSPAATEPLRFAAALFRAQARVADELAAAHARAPLEGGLEAGAKALIEPGRALFAALAEAGAEVLAAEARAPPRGETERFPARRGGHSDGEPENPAEQPLSG